MARSLIVLLAAVFCLLARLEAQEQPKVVKGTVQVGIHKVTLSPEYVYEILVESGTSEMHVTLGDVPSQWVNYLTDDPKAIRKVERLCSPVKKCEGEIRIEPGYQTPGGPQAYTLTVRPVKLDPKPILNVKGTLTDKDNRPNRGSVGREHVVKLAKGKRYVVEMSVDLKDAVPFPSCWCQVDEEKDSWSIVTSSDQGGKPARCVIRPKFDGEYKIDAALTAQDLRGARCGYTLKVFQQARD
jgi:hypothetical protein